VPTRYQPKTTWGEFRRDLAGADFNLEYAACCLHSAFTPEVYEALVDAGLDDDQDEALAEALAEVIARRKGNATTPEQARAAPPAIAAAPELPPARGRPYWQQ